MMIIIKCPVQVLKISSFGFQLLKLTSTTTLVKTVWGQAAVLIYLFSTIHMLTLLLLVKFADLQELNSTSIPISK